MSVKLKGRSLLTLKDYTKSEIEYILNSALKLKKKKQKGKSGNALKGKNIVLIFEKTSTRTRCAFETAIFDEGGNVTFLTNSQIGKKESIEDTARVLAGYYDGIEFRGFKQKTVEELAEYSGVPVWNGLTDLYHPTQILADLMTIREHTGKPFSSLKLTYVGDARNNMGNSLMIGSAKTGMDFTAAAPASLFPKEDLVKECRETAEKSGSNITLTEDPVEAVKDADIIYTDVWVSMGEEDQFESRIKLLKPYQVNSDLINASGNRNVKFMHCLPAFHDLNTEIGRKIYQQYGLKELEVTDDVFRGSQSIVFDQAENRMHSIKAVILSTL